MEMEVAYAAKSSTKSNKKIKFSTNICDMIVIAQNYAD